MLLVACVPLFPDQPVVSTTSPFTVQLVTLETFQCRVVGLFLRMSEGAACKCPENEPTGLKIGVGSMHWGFPA